ncbi:unnamed protein product [Ceratitis capitata]|uniref:(Mediterranean fruit fly) hypothetical protein n=1 Tax=Ceratitis capitata TaxID=7213 RepID=A0A811VGL5_CERCA|nr:unnamed protein product [Ceratitis capitata]
MSTQKRNKINNSYESEPSSGSSLSEPLEYSSVYDGSMHLQYVLKPPSYETEVVIQADGNYLISSQDNKIPLIPTMSTSLPEICEEQTASINNENIICKPSSLESPFKGFTESPYGKLQREFFHSSSHLSNSLEKPLLPAKSNTVLRFYDMIVEENSCNAVDIRLPKEYPVPTADENSQENGVDYLLGLSKESKELRLSYELSFNGKIKSLTPSTEIENEATIEMQNLLNKQSFVLKKYRNEKSPDIFCDDEEDEDNDVIQASKDENCFSAEELIEYVETTDNVDDTVVAEDIVIENQEQTELTAYKEEEREKIVEEYTDTSFNKSFNCQIECSLPDNQSCETNTQAPEHQLRADKHSLFRDNCRREKELLRRIRKCLAGLPPPPSLTIPQLDMFSEVLNRKQDILDFTVDIDTSSNSAGACSSPNTSTSLFKPSHPMNEAKEMGWRQVLGVRQHGLCFNLCKASESNEYLALSVIERFIGAETASSYRNSPSSAKKRNARMKLLTQSPGNRLSHLARRRATFSSAQLATQKSNNVRGPQILVDVQKKNKHRRKNTPKRMTPGSKKKARKTPSSSARKRLFRCDLIKPGPSREASKRALFQSPPKQVDYKPPVQRLIPTIKPEIANRVEKSKRALFSPDKKTDNTNILSNTNYQLNLDRKPSFQLYSAKESRLSVNEFDSVLKRKRSAIDDDDTGDSADLPSQSNKLFRGGAENLTPQPKLLYRTGSSATTTTATVTSTAVSNVDLVLIKNLGLSGSAKDLSSAAPTIGASKIQRAHSEMVAQSNSLTENQRKKLLWAVSQALQEKKITTNHESFKQFAAVLARVVRRIFQEFSQKSSTSNSETLLRLAKRYVHYVISGRCADDIYIHAKAKIVREKNESSSRLSGYIGPEEYQRFKDSQKQQLHEDQINSFSQSSMRSSSISNIFSTEPSLDSFRISGINEFALSSTFTSQSQSLTESGSTKQFSSNKKMPIQSNSSLQNSSSKNNMCGLALRENVNFESEQRRSAQKNFTGKDQRNVSPYAHNNNNNYHNNNQLKASNNISSVPVTMCRTSAAKAQLHTTNISSADSKLLYSASTKVKRQISFDN